MGNYLVSESVQSDAQTQSDATQCQSDVMIAPTMSVKKHEETSLLLDSSKLRNVIDEYNFEYIAPEQTLLGKKWALVLSQKPTANDVYTEIASLKIDGIEQFTVTKFINTIKAWNVQYHVFTYDSEEVYAFLQDYFVKGDKVFNRTKFLYSNYFANLFSTIRVEYDENNVVTLKIEDKGFYLFKFIVDE